MKFKIFFLVLLCFILSVIVTRQDYLIKVPKEDRQLTNVTEETIKHKVERVVDGDSFFMTNGIEIRLYGIDAPEIGQTCTLETHESDSVKKEEIQCGANALDKLSSLIKGREVICTIRGKDAYERLVGDCGFEVVNKRMNRTDRVNINKEMVSTGNAVAFTQISDKYVEDETKAKQENLGIWSTNFETPSEYRKKNRKL